MKTKQNLRLIAYTLIGTIIGLNVNIDKASAQRLSARQCQRAHQQIAQYYAQRQPSLLNSNAYQQWANSMMNTIRQFEAENPECPKVTRTLSGQDIEDRERRRRELNRRQAEMRRQQIEQDTEFRSRQMCMGYGGDWDSRRQKCYYD